MKESILKLTVSLLAALLCFGVQSCSNDNDDEPIPPSDISTIIVGKWMYSAFSPNPYESIEDMDPNDTSFSYECSETGSLLLVLDYYTFYENGTGYRYHHNDYKHEFKWEFIMDRLYITYTNGGHYCDYTIYKAGKNVIYAKPNISAYGKLAKFVRY